MRVPPGGGLEPILKDHAPTLAATLSVDVNEQNAAAVAFYRRLGFRQVERSPLDDTGRPYPILHLGLGAGFQLTQSLG